MATEPSNNAAAEQPIIINVQYIKDLSFEAPSAPMIFAKMQEEAPDMNVNVNVAANPIQDNTFETVLEINAACKIKDCKFLHEIDASSERLTQITCKDLRANIARFLNGLAHKYRSSMKIQ